LISFDFHYFRPRTLADAVQTFQGLESEGLKPLYYSGGTEIITMARANQLHTRAVIDIKSIPECCHLHTEGEQWVYGAAVTLSEAAAGNTFPLLGETIRHLADRTTRNKTTLGGNVCGKIHYREALLPFLLTDAQAVVAGPAGARVLPVGSVFAEGRRPSNGDLLVQLHINGRHAAAPFYHRKRTRVGGGEYPLVTVAAIRSAGQIRVAVSGLCSYPFRSPQMEERLNNPGPHLVRVDEAIHAVPAPILNDLLGSGEYRVHLLRLSLLELMAKFEGGEAG
jgi:CO/xanthine dehydrogenase FAD-binding subunit